MNINPTLQTPTGCLVLVIRDAVRRLLHDFAISPAELRSDLIEIVFEENPGPDPRD